LEFIPSNSIIRAQVSCFGLNIAIRNVGCVGASIGAHNALGIVSSLLFFKYWTFSRKNSLVS